MAPFVNNQFVRNLQFAFSVSLIIEGFFFLICALFALFVGNEIGPFLWPAFFSLFFGAALYHWSDRKISPIKENRHFFLLITGNYFLFVLLGTLPYLLSGTLPRFVDAFFESTSGFTATGSSVISNIEQLPQSIILWRSLTQWIGGFYTIATVLFIFPWLNSYGRSALMPTDNILVFFNVKEKVVNLAAVYGAVTLLQVLVLSFEGMDFFKSCCYAFGTAATGCFAPENAPLAGYSSSIHYTFMLFMFVAGLGYLPFMGPVNEFIKSRELKQFGVAVLFAAIGLSLIIFFQLGFTGSDAIRIGLFQALSFLSSTGFTNVDLSNMTDLILLLFMALLVIGSGVGSASGGIQLFRLTAILKHIRSTFSSYQPLASVKNSRKENSINALSPLVYVFLFGFLMVIGLLVLLLFGITPSRASFFAISAISTVGHPIDLASYPAIVKLVLSGLMLLGRLEIYPILLLLFPLFYRSEIHFKNKRNNE